MSRSSTFFQNEVTGVGFLGLGQGQDVYCDNRGKTLLDLTLRERKLQKVDFEPVFGPVSNKFRAICEKWNARRQVFGSFWSVARTPIPHSVVLIQG